MKSNVDVSLITIQVPDAKSKLSILKMYLLSVSGNDPFCNSSQMECINKIEDVHGADDPDDDCLPTCDEVAYDVSTTSAIFPGSQQMPISLLSDLSKDLSETYIK